MNKVYTLFNLFLSFILTKNPHGYPVKYNNNGSDNDINDDYNDIKRPIN